jgi:hypothetical protein
VSPPLASENYGSAAKHGSRKDQVVELRGEPAGDAARRPWAFTQGTSQAFNSVDPAGTWAWPVPVRWGAVLALLPAEAAVQLHAEAVVVDLLLSAEAVVVELPLRAEAAVQLHAEAVGVELPLRAEAAVQLHAEAVGVELPLRAEAAVQLRAEAVGVELPLRAEAAAELPLHAEAAGVELPRRAEAAYALTVRQEACDCREASRCSLRGRLLHPRCPATAHREAHVCPEWPGCCLDRFSHLVLPARCRSLRRRRHPHDGLAARLRQPVYPDARRQRRHRSIAPGVWSPQL